MWLIFFNTLVYVADVYFALIYVADVYFALIYVVDVYFALVYVADVRFALLRDIRLFGLRMPTEDLELTSVTRGYWLSTTFDPVLGSDISASHMYLHMVSLCRSAWMSSSLVTVGGMDIHSIGRRSSSTASGPCQHLHIHWI